MINLSGSKREVEGGDSVGASAPETADRNPSPTTRGVVKKIRIFVRVESYLLELLNGTLVNTTALVDQVTCIIYEYRRNR